MTHREAMLAAIAGRPSDRLPWAPRLDLWYKANRLAGTLPARFRKATLPEMVDELGWARHAIVPDFRDLSGGGDDADRALGLYNLACMPFRVVLEGVERRVEARGERTFVEYRTPAGTIRTVTLYDESMRRAGISISHVEERAFRSPEDYPALGWIFEHARVEENFAGYDRFRGEVGGCGLAAAFVSLAASPMHLIQRELMPFETFCFELADHPAELDELARRIGRLWAQMLAAAARSSAELVFLGANYDATVTYPPFFEEHILPSLRDYAAALHGLGKLLLTHTDGENRGLLGHYLAAGFDVADSVCPAPMTSLGFREVREAFAGRITIMGGIPSVTLLPDSMNDRDFSAYLDGFLEAAGAGDRLILGISDTTPPGADFGRLLEIARRAEAFGPVRPLAADGGRR
ncbi:MAG TPA: uroporphyrinogen decarboxylase family protein [Planctomycetota bacterium]|nr:uroporphyrinogen decarboxylase family protein [Planctomycetota bacterium]